MAKFNTNSNAYTIIYASVLVIVVAFLLAFVSLALKEPQDANVRIDKKSQILAALNVRGLQTSEVEAKYSEVVTSEPIYGKATEYVSETGAFDVANKDIKPENRPFYVCNVDGATKYVIPVKGTGLWGGISGYIAIDDDCETVFGTYFTHESETAGLGDRIKEQWFQESFMGKKIYAQGNPDEVALSVVKKGKEGAMAPENYVNGVTGATLTFDGVDKMVEEGIALYQDIFVSLKK